MNIRQTRCARRVSIRSVGLTVLLSILVSLPMMMMSPVAAAAEVGPASHDHQAMAMDCAMADASIGNEGPSAPCEEHGQMALCLTGMCCIFSFQDAATADWCALPSAERLSFRDGRPVFSRNGLPHERPPRFA
jgi:hypothetical protein